MNSAASNTIASEYLGGFFGVLDTSLSGKTQFSQGDLDDLHPRDLTELLSRPTAVRLQAGMKTGGGIVVLFRAGDIGAVVTAASGQPPQNPDSPTEADFSAMKKILDPCMGGGVGHFKETFGTVVELENIAVLPCAPAATQELAALLGPNVTVAPFHFVAPVTQGDAVLLFSQTLEGIVPADRLGETEDGTTPSLLSGEELTSILSGFDSGKAPQTAGPTTTAQAAASQIVPAVKTPPGNLDMVLDIRLTAMARLGRMEMLVSDILSLGPGSIIDVGHAVDEPVDLLVNGRLIARGDVVVVDEKFGLRITEIVAPQQRIESLR